MATAQSLYRKQAIEEIEKIPAEYLPALLKVMQAFREGVTLPPAEDSFRQGWQEALTDQTQSVSELWEDNPLQQSESLKLLHDATLR